MAHTVESQSVSAASPKAIRWLKILGGAGLLVIGLFSVINLIGGISGSTGNSEWETVAKVTCSPTWNQERGWCTVVTDAAKGTYRVVPRYKSWQLWQNDGSFIPIPPHGLDVYSYWSSHEEFIEEFSKTAHKKGSRNYGALITRIGDGEVIEALNASRVPREFEVTEDGADIAVTVNLTPLSNFYQYNQGVIPVEVQRRD